MAHHQEDHNMDNKVHHTCLLAHSKVASSSTDKMDRIIMDMTLMLTTDNMVVEIRTRIYGGANQHVLRLVLHNYQPSSGHIFFAASG